MAAIFSVLPPARAGTAIVMALRQAGRAVGVALPGSLLTQQYADRVAVSHLPAEATDAARDSIASALAIAARFGDDTRAASAKRAPTSTA